MVAGRPPYDRMAIGREFVEWAKDNPEALTVPGFTAYRDMCSETLIEWANEDKEFSKLYKQGLELIGLNRLKSSCGKDPYLPPFCYQKTSRHYDKTESKAHRIELKDEAKIKAEAALRAAKKMAKKAGVDLSSPEGKAQLKSVLESL